MFADIRLLVMLNGDNLLAIEARKREKQQSNWLANCVLRGEDSGGGCETVAPDHPFEGGKLRDECTLEFAPYLGINCFPSVSGPE